MKERWVVIVLLLLGISTFSGCISEGTVTGTLVLHITDAPTTLEISEALVTISQVEVHIVGLGGWKTVVQEPQTFELISLENAHELLGSANLSEGRYTQIRLHVDNALVTIEDRVYDLRIPSQKILLNSPFEIKHNQTTVLTLDFDVHQSVRYQPIHSSINDRYFMIPTIKVIAE
jgi:hypothetical protein